MNATRLSTLLLPFLIGCADQSSMNTLVGHSDLANAILDIYARITWWSAILFILVQGLLIYIMLRFRAKGTEATNPEQIHGNTRLEIAWTILPVFILLHIGIPTVAFIFKSQAEAAEDAIVVNAVGRQWWFAFEYPELGVTTANELHVPLGEQVEIRLQSDNVIHSLWAPQLFAKRDMIPGRLNRITFRAEKVGMYLGQCAEYCGDSHALMKFRVFVDTPEDFQKWVAAQKTPVVAAAEDAGYAAFAQAGCVACHRVDGTPAVGTAGPDLTHVGSRSRIASGILDNNAENLEKWILDPPGVKPGSKMPNLKLSPENAKTISNWLLTLK